MFDRIIYIDSSGAKVSINNNYNISNDLVNLHLILEDNTRKIISEITSIDNNIINIKFLGEIIDNKLVCGIDIIPSIKSTIRIIDKNELILITKEDDEKNMLIGSSPIYNMPLYIDINEFFSNHFLILGNSGSGKSCGFTRLIQNLFLDKKILPFKANIFLFDISGEYYNAFSNINTININYNYRCFTTNNYSNNKELLKIPFYLLNSTDIAQLLQVESHKEIPIIENTINIARIIGRNDEASNKYKNHLIATAILNILYSSIDAKEKKNEIFSIVTRCSTNEFNLDAIVEGIGYRRKFRDCFLIDNQSNFTESVLINEYVNKFIHKEYDKVVIKGNSYYDINIFKDALEFTLISDGWLRNELTYNDAISLKVKLSSFINSGYSTIFEYNNLVSLDKYLSSLIISNGKKYQIINFNLEDIDDYFAKVITKIFSRFIFSYSKSLQNKASIPFHIIMDEAHRYIQNDSDRKLFGYNIFERIAKEGRKYGVILGLISQRPVEISDNVISQCSNFLLFRMNHPYDIEYMMKMIPNISSEIIEKQKTLQSGTCIGFGTSFNIVKTIKMLLPNPMPISKNANIISLWRENVNDKVIKVGTPNNTNTNINTNNINLNNNITTENNSNIPNIVEDKKEDIKMNRFINLDLDDNEEENNNIKIVDSNNINTNVNIDNKIVGIPEIIEEDITDDMNRGFTYNEPELNDFSVNVSSNINTADNTNNNLDLTLDDYDDLDDNFE